MRRSASRFKYGLSICIFAGSGSQTTTAASMPGRDVQRLLQEFDGTGQSRKVKLSSRYFVVATLTSTLICRSRASTLASPTVFFLRDRAFALDRAGGEENAFQKRGLAAAVWSPPGPLYVALFLHWT